MISIRHSGLVTKNLKKSLEFWKGILKFKIKKDLIEIGKNLSEIFGIKNLKVRTIKLADKNGNLIELLYFLNAPKRKKQIFFPYSTGLTHISVTVKNIEKTYKSLKKSKYHYKSKPLVSSDGKVLMTYCKTPENCFLEIVEEL